ITHLTPMSNGAPMDLLQGYTPGQKAPPTPMRVAEPPTPGQVEGNTAPPKRQIDSIEIQGLYLDNPKEAEVIDDFFNNLIKSDQFAIDIKAKNKLISRRSTPDNLTWAYGYTITLPLKHPIELP
ncbi:MAG: hypothetical protein ABIP97_07250, partial [Chthoniobacterales bacterium]